MEKTVAIYPGRFQPFGPHHYEAYKQLANKFGVEDTYIATQVKPILKGHLLHSKKKNKSQCHMGYLQTK